MKISLIMNLICCFLLSSFLFGVSQSVDKLRVLSYNVQLLHVPFGKDAPGIMERSEIIPEYVKDYDVIVFQEAWDREAGYNLLAGLSKVGYRYSTAILGYGLNKKYPHGEKGLGKDFENKIIDLDPKVQEKLKPEERYDFGNGRRSWAVEKMMEFGIDVANVGAQVASVFTKAFAGKKSKIEKKVATVKEELQEIMHNGGVLIVSKYPITNAKEHIFKEPIMGDIEKKYLTLKHFNLKEAFKDAFNADWFANKGVLYARIEKKVGDKTIPYNIFGTHTNALYRGAPENLRKELARTVLSQCDQIATFIGGLNLPKKEAVIIAGDFNINQFRPNDEAYPYRDIFNSMVTKLNAFIPHLKGPQCVTGNDISGKPPAQTCTPSRIDYVMTSKNYKMPVIAYNEFKFMRTAKPWDEEGKRHSLSDHEGMLGYFEFAL